MSVFSGNCIGERIGLGAGFPADAMEKELCRKGEMEKGEKWDTFYKRMYKVRSGTGGCGVSVSPVAFTEFPPPYIHLIQK